MGEKTKETLKLQFDKRLRLEFHLLGARKRDLSRPYSLPKSIAESKAKFKQLNLPLR